jgi:hypothetical protein
MTKKKKANTPEEFPVFSKLDLRQVTVLCAKFKFYVGDYGETQGLSDIVVDQSIMIEICERIEKRRIYFHIFYDRKMGELNEGALMCFWILKLMPFSHNDIPASELNAKMALYLLNNAIIYHARQSKKKVNISDSFNKNLYYSFRFRDISKEAIMELAEGLIID